MNISLKKTAIVVALAAVVALAGIGHGRGLHQPQHGHQQGADEFGVFHGVVLWRMVASQTDARLCALAAHRSVR